MQYQYMIIQFSADTNIDGAPDLDKQNLGQGQNEELERVQLQGQVESVHSISDNNVQIGSNQQILDSHNQQPIEAQENIVADDNKSEGQNLVHSQDQQNIEGQANIVVDNNESEGQNLVHSQGQVPVQTGGNDKGK